MCGMFGWQMQDGTIKKSQLNIIAAVLMSENDRRGGDSWGYSYLDGKTIQTSRGLGLISKGARAARLADHRQVMAHTRRASTGAVTVENAHPYHIGKIIGAHNGVVYNHKELNDRYRRTCVVDSMHVFLHIKEGKDLSELVGWGAIEYLHTDRPWEVLLGRFKSGELAIRGLGTKSKDSTGLVWSSGGMALEKALSAAGVRSFEYKIDHQVLYKAVKGALYHVGELPIAERQTLTEADLAMSRATGTFREKGGDKKFLVKKRDEGV